MNIKGSFKTILGERGWESKFAAPRQQRVLFIVPWYVHGYEWGIADWLHANQHLGSVDYNLQRIENHKQVFYFLEDSMVGMPYYETTDYFGDFDSVVIHDHSKISKKGREWLVKMMRKYEEAYESN